MLLSNVEFNVDACGRAAGYHRDAENAEVRETESYTFECNLVSKVKSLVGDGDRAK
jgi:hypothetical protein